MGRAEDYWNQYYQSPTPTAPSSFLKTMLPRLSKGKCLDIGMGLGVNASLLAENGFEVVGIDISEKAIEYVKGQTEQKNLKITAKKTDLDLFIFGLMEYDSIVVVNFRPSVTRYYSEFIRSLKMGGTILFDSLLIDEMGEAIGDDEAYRNFYFKHNEILRHLKDMRILFYQESKIEGQQRVQCLAQKPMDRDAAKYDFFNIQSKKQEDHAHNKQRELAEQLFKKKS